mmetsp:Transcript_66985/g.160478  ORF Transcript_66985/g.160478 Transcript_66985/m.160478 type:complete len:355 (-) Transcript_66985:70-1134(-)
MSNLARCERHSGTGCVAKTPVVLHIYDLTRNESAKNVNSVLTALGAGAYHAGVEVYGKEWSFGCEAEEGESGIFSVPPRGATDHHYRGYLSLGMTTKSRNDVARILDAMAPEWMGTAYDLLRHNCCHFCDAFCAELGVDGLPFWVSLNIAGLGASLRRIVRSTMQPMESWEEEPQVSTPSQPGTHSKLSRRQTRGFDDGSGGCYRLGDAVDIFSNSTQSWCGGVIESVQDGRLIVAFQPPGVAAGAWARKELGVDSKILRRQVADDATPKGSAPGMAMLLGRTAPQGGAANSKNYVAGESVEVFSNSFQRWFPGFVENVQGEMVSVAFYHAEGADPARKDLHKDHSCLRKMHAK